jgi:hypothetical protein
MRIVKQAWNHKGKIATGLVLALGVSALAGAYASSRQCENHLVDSTSPYRTCRYDFNLPANIDKFWQYLANTSG